MATWINSDGLEVRFGGDIGNRGMKAGVTTGAGKLRELVLDIDLTDLAAGGTGFTADLDNDGTNEAFNSSNTPLPVGALIHSQRVIVMETPVGGGTGAGYTIGTYEEDGTVVDADGIRVAAGTDGAQVGTVVSAATGPWYVAIDTAGDAVYTAGRLKVIVEFMTV